MLANDKELCWALLHPLEAQVVLHYACLNESAKTLCVFCVLLLD